MSFINIHNLDKRLIISASCFVFSSIMAAQGGFNLRIPIEGNTVFQSVHIASDSTFIVAGWSLDTTSNNHLDFELLKIGVSGQTILSRNTDNPAQVINEQQNTISHIPDYFAQFEQAYIDSEYAQRLFFFNSNLDILRSVFVQSPWKDSAWSSAEFMLSESLAISKDSCTFYSFGIANTNVTANDLCIKKLSPSGDEIWSYIQSTAADPDACYALLPMDDGGVLAAIIQGPYEDIPAQDKLIKIDQNGTELWTLNNPGGYSKLINCIFDDGSDIIISGRHAVPNSTVYGTKGIVLKLDTLGNTHWVRTFGEYEELIFKDFTNVVKTCDENYVAGGTWLSTPGIDDIPKGEVDLDFDEFAYLIKLDRVSGDILWERKYRFLEIYEDQHILIDLKATLDGGVIFCGEARDMNQIEDGPIQQGWLVKLDECGCLVPGCDSLCNYVGCASNDTTAFFPPLAHHFIVGPNPATQFINIYFAGGDLDLSQTHFDLYDLQGRLVYSFVPDAPDTTYMLSTEQFASGTYVVLLHHNGEKVQEQKILIAGR